MEKISKKTLEKIKQNRISLRPKWFFKFKNYIFWSLFVLSILFGGLSVATLIYQYQKADSFSAYYYVHHSFLKAVILSLPYFWLVIILIFIGLAIYDFYLTKKSYRFNAFFMFIASFIISLALGIILFYGGIGKKIDQKLTQDFSFYRQISQQKEKIWNQPDRGLLAGKILEIKDQQIFVLQDLGGVIWEIDYQKVKIFGRAKIEVNEEIKIIGERQSDNTFLALQIRPDINGQGQKMKGKNSLK
ncbi:MAG: hypothetical protein PHW50_02930 [Patescibacteria group bacterium]|nr:hypothetical protein [Patescibacteria group bacterium]